MRDRLIELLKQVNFDFSEECVACCEDGYKTIPMLEDFFADHLLANGVIVPPVKVGYYIWFLQNDRLVLGLVENITVSRSGLFAYVFEIDEHNEIENEWSIPLCDFGKTVFLTKEEAEEKLEELKNGI